jgi:iron complex outermembrane recepter protein
VAVLGALAMVAAAISKADPPQNGAPLDEVVVTGLRFSLQSSAEIKQNLESISESVVAEDIGKLPDISVAEALARLPGVAAQRVNGRAQDLSIRGMGPQFALTLLNGNEMASTNLNRSFEYDQIPAELVSRLTVYKSSEVSLGNQGLAGTVDVRTVQPLGVEGRKVAVNARAETNSQGSLLDGVSSRGNRLSASYVDQFADRKLGVALGFSHLDSPTLKKYLNPWDYGHVVSEFGMNLPPAQAAADPLGWDGFENGVAATKSKRDAGIAVLEYRPGEFFHSTLTYLQSRFDESMRGAELVGDMADYAGAKDGHLTTFNSANSQTQSSAYMLDTLRGDNRLDSIHSVDWANEARLGSWNASFGASYSHAVRDERIGEAYVTNNAPMNYTFTYTGTGGFSRAVPGVDLGNPANMELSTYWGSGGYEEWVNTDDKSKAVRFALDRELGDGLLRKLAFGAFYSDRSKAESVVTYAMNLVQGSSCILGTCAPVPRSLGVSPVSLGFSGGGNLLYFDVLNALSGSGYFTPAPGDNKKTYYNWSVDEKQLTSFLKLNYAFDALIPWHGNVGAQVIRTDQSSTGLYTDSAGNQLRNNTGGATYTNVLPALMLIGDVAERTKLRIGVGQSLSRPQMGDMSAGISASIGPVLVDGHTKLLWSGDGGNPMLRPWKSTDYDLDIERYFTPSTYVALAFFEKRISSAIRQGALQYDFTGFVDPSGKVAASPIGSLTAPVNESGGYVRGVELSGQVLFGDVVDTLRGFGFSGNVAYSQSNLPGLNVDGTISPAITFDGLSKVVASAALFYERDGWQLRVAERYRSGYSAYRLNAFRFVIDTVEPEAILDAQIGYTFQSGTLKNLELQLQGENLTDRPYIVTQQAHGQSVLSQYHTFGRTFLAGVNYRF